MIDYKKITNSKSEILNSKQFQIIKTQITSFNILKVNHRNIICKSLKNKKITFFVFRFSIFKFWFLAFNFLVLTGGGLCH